MNLRRIAATALASAIFLPAASTAAMADPVDVPESTVGAGLVITDADEPVSALDLPMFASMNALGNIIESSNTDANTYGGDLLREAAYDGAGTDYESNAPSSPGFTPYVPPAPVYSGDNPILAEAATHAGKPYLWGGNGPSRFDCSGYTKWVYKHAVGKSIPRTAETQRRAATKISADEAVPGDLVFFGSPAHHVGIYAGNGKMWHSPRTGDVIKLSKIWNKSSVSYGRF